MTMLVRVLIVAMAAALSALPARAATTIFPVSVFSSSGVADPSEAVGFPNGVSALIAPGGDIVLQYGFPLTGAAVSPVVLPVAGFNILAVSIGEVIAGVATFSGEFVLVDDGSGPTLSADLTSACAGVSATGCSLLRIRNAGSLLGSTGVLLDGVSGVTAAPEPAVWALMILGFIGTAWRLKSARRESARRPAMERIFRFPRTLTI
jgi:hypothetical protein